jgi:hypothetical protein
MAETAVYLVILKVFKLSIQAFPAHADGMAPMSRVFDPSRAGGVASGASSY